MLCSRGLVNRLDIRKVLTPARRLFGREQIRAGNEVHPQTRTLIENGLHAPRPCGIKIDARNRGENVHPDWLAPYAKGRARLLKIGRGHTSQRRAELSQGGENRLRVLRIGFDQNIEIFGCARLA